MKNVQKLSLLSSNSQSIRGVSKTLAVLAAITLLALAPVVATAAETVSQLTCLQWLVKICGDGGQFSLTSQPQDYIQWAQSKGMTPAGGWKPTAVLTKSALSQILVQMVNLNPKKGGGDMVRILAREGIVLPDEENITREGLAHTFGDAGFASRIPETTAHSGSTKKPKHPNNGNGNGDG